MNIIQLKTLRDDIRSSLLRFETTKSSGKPSDSSSCSRVKGTIVRQTQDLLDYIQKVLTDRSRNM